MAGSTFRAPPLYSQQQLHLPSKFYPIRFILFPLTRSSTTRRIKPYNSLTNPSSIDSVSTDGFDLVSSTEHRDGSVIFKFGNAADIITDTVAPEESHVIDEMPINSDTGIADDVVKDEVMVISNALELRDNQGMNVDLVNTTEAKNNISVLGSSVVVSETEVVDDEGCCQEMDKEQVMVTSNTSEVVDEVEDKDNNGVESILVDEELPEESILNCLESSVDSVEGDMEQTQSEAMEVDSSVDVDQIQQEEEADDFTGLLGEDDPSEDDASRLNSTEIVQVVEEVSPQLREENVAAVISESVGTGLGSSNDSAESDIEKKSTDIVEVNGSVDVDRTKEKEPNEFTGVLGEDDPSMEASRRFSSNELVEVVGETSLHALENHDGRSTLESSKKMEDIVSLPKFHTENSDKATIATLEMTDSKEIGSQDVETSFDINSEGKELSRLRLTISSGATMLPHPSKALTGGEDAYFIACQNWFGVADGAGQWSLEGNNAGIYARELMENGAKVVSENERDPITDPAEILVHSAAVSTSSGSSTALVAHFTGQALQVANLGDSGFIVIRDGTIFMKSRPMFYGFNFPVQIAKGLDPSQFIESYTVDTAEGDVIICATDALFDNLYDNEIALIVSKSLESGSEPKEIAEHLAAITQEVAKSSGVRSPFADAAQAAGYSGISGGKLDDVTVIVSLVHN